ncbi:hypothetical protein D3C78_1587940 [compost metagenome]
MLVLRPAFQLELDVRLDVFHALRQPGQVVRPQVEAIQQVFAEAAFQHRLLQIAVGAGDQLEIALHFAVTADRQEALLFQRPQQHRLFVLAEFADLVQEQQPLVR